MLSNTALALAPAPYTELCRVEGSVLSLGKADGTDMMMKRLKVPTVKLKLTHVKKSGIKEASFIDCQTLTLNQVYTFRNCEDFRFKVGKKIAGIVGRSKGGGPHCIDQVQQKR